MRTRTVAALTLLLALGPAGCARSEDGAGVATAITGGATPGASPSASASSDPDAPLKFARCMREHGLPWFPDPNSDGGTAIGVPDGTDPTKIQAAQEACKQFQEGGRIGKPPAADIEALRQVAKCMRENGVPKFPDPKPDGRLEIDGSAVGMGPGDPTFDKADKICSKYAPKGAQKNTARDSGGGGTSGRAS
jgi:hypothetical protein